MSCRLPTLIGLGYVIRTGFGQSDLTMAALKRGDLAQAQVSANLESNLHSSERAWTLCGLLQATAGRMELAEIAFDHALSLTSQAARQSGFEPSFAPGTIAFARLQRVKGVFSASLGEAAARNNRGLARLLLGRISDAFVDLDRAAVIQPGWGTPWANGAAAWLRKGMIDKALTNARMADSLGERSASAIAILAEAELAAFEIDRASDDLKRAFKLVEDHPVALVVKSKLDAANGKARESERAYIKALAGGPIVALDSSFGKGTNTGDGLTGSVGEVHLKLGSNALPSERRGFELRLSSDKQNVEGRSAAGQAKTDFRGVYSDQAGAFVVLYSNEAGGRPGATNSVLGVAPASASKLKFDQFEALAIRKLGDFTFHASVRTSSVDTRSDSVSPTVQALKDRQWLGELRYDSTIDNRTVTAGVALANIQRSGSGPSALEPTEQIIPFGNESLGTAYAVIRSKFRSGIHLSTGAMLGVTPSAKVVLPVLDFGTRLAGTDGIRFGVKSRLNNAVSNLIPDGMLADEAVSNGIDRSLLSVASFNRTPIIEGKAGRQTAIELSTVVHPSEQLRCQICFFRNDITDSYVQGADPRVATRLSLTPIASGSATGISAIFDAPVSPMDSIRTSFCVQQSNGRTKFPTYLISDFPTLTAVNGRRIPDFASLQASCAFEHRQQGFVTSLVGNFVGSRLHALSVNTGGGSGATFVEEAPAAFGLSLFAQKSVGERAKVSLALFNLTRVNFYPGYPGSTTLTFGFNYSF